MLNLIYRILVPTAYDSLVLDIDAVIWPLLCCLHPVILYYSVSVAMNTMSVILKMRA